MTILGFNLSRLYEIAASLLSPEGFANEYGYGCYPSPNPTTDEEIKYAQKFEQLAQLFLAHDPDVKDVNHARFAASDAVGQKIIILEYMPPCYDTTKEDAIDVVIGEFLKELASEAKYKNGSPAGHLSVVDPTYPVAEQRSQNHL